MPAPWTHGRHQASHPAPYEPARRAAPRQGAPPRRELPGRHAPRRAPLWIGPAEPGSVHDVTAARWHALPALYRAAALGMPCLADNGYEGAGIGILVPVKSPPATRNST